MSAFKDEGVLAVERAIELFTERGIAPPQLAEATAALRGLVAERTGTGKQTVRPLTERYWVEKASMLLDPEFLDKWEVGDSPEPGSEVDALWRLYLRE